MTPGHRTAASKSARGRQMKPGSVKIAIIGLVAAVSFLALLQWAIGAYSRQELERLTEKEQADFRAHLQTEHLRVIDRRLERLEQKLIFGNALPDPALQPSSGMTEGTRHYFGLCHDDGLARLSAGMTAVAARDLCSGREYAPFETVRNGFTFALDDARTQFFNFVGWMPQGDAQYDFLTPRRPLCGSITTRMGTSLW